MNDHHKGSEKQEAVVQITRRQVLSGVAALLVLAVIMAFALIPRRAAAPRNDTDLTADEQTEEQLGQAQPVDNDQALMAEDCALVQTLTYTPCGHQVVRRVALPSELAGKGRAELEAAYDQWQVTAYQASQAAMARTLPIYCPQHMILMADASGRLGIYENKYGEALALVETLDASLSAYPDAVAEEISRGIGFDTLRELEEYLEMQES